VIHLVGFFLLFFVFSKAILGNDGSSSSSSSWCCSFSMLTFRWKITWEFMGGNKAKGMRGELFYTSFTSGFFCMVSDKCTCLF
jgi:hypothetical protein